MKSIITTLLLSGTMLSSAFVTATQLDREDPGLRASAQLSPALADHGIGVAESLNAGGVSVTVASNAHYGPRRSDLLMVFNSDERIKPRGTDDDLHVSVGWSIAISEAGRVDDERAGGTISLAFPLDSPITRFQTTVIDSEEGTSFVFHYSDGGPPSLSAMFVTGNGKTTDLLEFDFDRPVVGIQAVLGGSGALGDTGWDSAGAPQIPEPRILLLGTLGFSFLFIRRNRR